MKKLTQKRLLEIDRPGPRGAAYADVWMMLDEQLEDYGPMSFSEANTHLENVIVAAKDIQAQLKKLKQSVVRAGKIQKRLEYLRDELQAGTMSYAELAELQDLAPHIPDGDLELQEAAGIPEEEARH